MRIPLSAIGATLDGSHYVTVSTPTGKRGAARLDYVKRDLKTQDDARRESLLYDSGILRRAIAAWHTATNRHELHTYTFARNKDACIRALSEVNQHLAQLDALRPTEALTAIADLLAHIQDWIELYADQRVRFQHISDTNDLLDLINRYRTAWLAAVKAA